ncbi:MAG: hypothetical protein AAF441_09335 [Pseudomonadota bacterium]
MAWTAEQRQSFFERGWCRFGFEQSVFDWVSAALPHARAAVSDPENDVWFRCGRTWFVGVNALPNKPDSSVGSHGPVGGAVRQFITEVLGHDEITWDQAQVSVCYPGYPRPYEGETEGAYRFRLNRDAAHVDGLLREGPDSRRFLREHHAFILGLPMAETGPEASPVVVYEGSHELMREAFAEFFGDAPSGTWGAMDMTEAYHAVRREAFETCSRITLPALPGEAYLIHRLALHGVAPWAEGATAGPDGRMVCYFRPETGDPAAWLNAP